KIISQLGRNQVLSTKTILLLFCYTRVVVPGHLGRLLLLNIFPLILYGSNIKLKLRRFLKMIVEQTNQKRTCKTMTFYRFLRYFIRVFAGFRSLICHLTRKTLLIITNNQLVIFLKFYYDVPVCLTFFHVMDLWLAGNNLFISFYCKNRIFKPEVGRCISS
ncbi:hypothetical protein L9F63_016587, partial [Diploptera punctata]